MAIPTIHCFTYAVEQNKKNRYLCVIRIWKDKEYIDSTSSIYNCKSQNLADATALGVAIKKANSLDAIADARKWEHLIRINFYTENEVVYKDYCGMRHPETGEYLDRIIKLVKADNHFEVHFKAYPYKEKEFIQGERVEVTIV